MIGYTLLALAFIGLLAVLPSITPNGLSRAEMESAALSNEVNHETILNGNIIDLPYHVLQKASLMIFGLTTYGIKLPSIILGAILGFLLILLLNRWFKNNVAIMASILAVLSSSFLYISGSGTPLIMVVFWPTLLLWLGSKIQGVDRPKPFYCFLFSIFLLLSLFTPYMIFLAVFIVLYTLAHPHLRFTIKHLPRPPLMLTVFIGVCGIALILMNAIKSGNTINSLAFMKDFTWDEYWANIPRAFTPFFRWNGMVESTFLAPLIGLASLALAITGLISTYNGFFASRNSIATCLILFTIFISGFNPDCAILLILPLAILIAHGFRYILNKWFGLFPENPYARVFGFVPIAIFLGIMISSDISHFIFGYRYNPAVANEFSNDLQLIYEHVEDGSALIVKKDELSFYRILESDSMFGPKKQLYITTEIPRVQHEKIAKLGTNEDETKVLDFKDYKLDHIVTSSKSQNSDRIYLYTLKHEDK